MAKRETVEVDEDLLKEVMAGGAGRFRKTAPVVDKAEEKPVQPPVKTELPVIKETESAVPPIEGNGEAKETAKPLRKRREQPDYENMFLVRRASVPRRQTYISTHLYEKIGSFLPVIAGQLSITAYIDNILIQHLEQYKEDINELYEKKSQKPF
jgi:hypothetical protein